MDMNYIHCKFLKYTNIVSWCEGYAKENNAKTSIRLVDHINHKTITTDDVARMLYNKGIPEFRNTYNLRSFKKEEAIFHLTVKGMSIALICSFIYEPKTEGEYKVDINGQLSFVL
jgi:hypothetical protein